MLVVFSSARFYNKIVHVQSLKISLSDDGGDIEIEIEMEGKGEKMHKMQNIVVVERESYKILFFLL